ADLDLFAEPGGDGRHFVPGAAVGPVRGGEGPAFADDAQANAARFLQGAVVPGPLLLWLGILADLPVRPAAPLAAGEMHAGPLETDVVLVVLPDQKAGRVERPATLHQAARIGGEWAGHAHLGDEIAFHFAQDARAVGLADLRREDVRLAGDRDQQPPFVDAEATLAAGVDRRAPALFQERPLAVARQRHGQRQDGKDQQ